MLDQLSSLNMSFLHAFRLINLYVIYIYIYRLIYLILLINQITCTISHNSLPVFCFIICLEILCRFLATDSSYPPSFCWVRKTTCILTQTSIVTWTKRGRLAVARRSKTKTCKEKKTTRLRNWFLVETVKICRPFPNSFIPMGPWFSSLTSTCLGFTWIFSGLRLVLFGNEAQGSASGSQKTKHTQALTTHESQESLLRCSTLWSLWSLNVVPSSKHGIGMYRGYGHPSYNILGIITMGILNPIGPIDGWYDHPLLWENKPCFDRNTHVLCKVWQLSRRRSGWSGSCCMLQGHRLAWACHVQTSGATILRKTQWAGAPLLVCQGTAWAAFGGSAGSESAPLAPLRRNSKVVPEQRITDSTHHALRHLGISGAKKERESRSHLGLDLKMLG